MNKMKDIQTKWEMFLNESSMLDEKYKRKPGCTRPGEKGHNYHHDENGRFSSKEDATSWSNDVDFYGGDRKDCIGGKFKTKGTNHKYWTKNKCGAKKNGGKNKYICKSGDLSETNDIDEFLESEVRAYIEAHSNPYDRALVEKVLDEISMDESRQKCPTWGDFMQRLNAMISATKGDLYKQRKKRS